MPDDAGPLPDAHPPGLHRKTGAGDMGDAMMDVDYNVGLIMAALKRMKLDNNTLVMWCTDTAPRTSSVARVVRTLARLLQLGDGRRHSHPCVMRWVGTIPRGQVSNAVFHELDIFRPLPRRQESRCRATVRSTA
ncbi:MAG: sulfatase-like hydrolase/transferase [Gemmatimonadetes bacterium]|nr:sulfatase-like hydrolase/transferase [Gemmatimonadota bacterium]